jgi:hypothetical protein
VERDCGSLLHRAPDDITIPQRFHVLCYITLNDTSRYYTICENLLADLPYYDDSHGLIVAGGDYGCWVGDSIPHPQWTSSCHDNYQHDMSLSKCTNCIIMTVCLRYPDGSPAQQHQMPELDEV